MGADSRHKLFRAIVSMGLAAAGCGGREMTSGSETTTVISSTASGTSTASRSTADAAQDALADASTGPIDPLDGSLDDASLASDVAADVAQTWFPPPIR